MLSPHRTNEFCRFNVSFDFGFIYYHYRSLCLCICLCVVFAKRPMPFFNSSLCSISNPFSAETPLPLTLPLVVSQFCWNILDKSRFPPYFLVSYHFRSHFLNLSQMSTTATFSISLQMAAALPLIHQPGYMCTKIILYYWHFITIWYGGI